MEISCDYEDLFKVLNEFKIKYLVVGAYAVMYHSEPRYTKDVDVWIIPELNNPDNVFKALGTFGAPLSQLHPKDFTDKTMILQIGVAPVRIDVMVDVPGISFKKAWMRRKKIRYGDTPINVLGIEDLIKAKKASNRPQDKLDIARLKRASKRA